MENVRLYQTVNICTDAKKFRNKIVPNNRFVQAIIIHEDLVFCKMLNKKTLLNKPIFVGGTILDLSKLHMYKFHYDIMMKYYGDNIKFFHSDTDSLMYEVNTEDLYDDLRELAEHFDFSSFPSTHPLHNCTPRLSWHTKNTCRRHPDKSDTREHSTKLLQFHKIMVI